MKERQFFSHQEISVSFQTFTHLRVWVRVFSDHWLALEEKSCQSVQDDLGAGFVPRVSVGRAVLRQTSCTQKCPKSLVSDNSVLWEGREGDSAPLSKILLNFCVVWAPIPGSVLQYYHLFIFFPHYCHTHHKKDLCDLYPKLVSPIIPLNSTDLDLLYLHDHILFH